jgi:inosose dehydratase
MKSELSRRGFLGGAGICLLGAAMPIPAADAWGELLPGDDATVSFGKARLKFGYTAMTWGKQERQAIDDISALGFPGIQFRDNAVKEFQPAELGEILKQHQLTFVALSSGTVDIDPAVEKDQIAFHVANANYVRAAGGLYLQVLDKLSLQRPRVVTPDECKRLGRLLTEIGKRTADLGVSLGYHNHMDTISERPENLALVLEHSDPRYVHLLLDTAHYLGGGGDPAEAIVKYRHRLLFLHLKDMIDEPMGTERNQKYPVKFVELGRGRLDFKSVFAALSKVRYRGWAVIELDRVPNKTETPKAAAEISRAYLEKTFGLKV